MNCRDVEKALTSGRSGQERLDTFMRTHIEGCESCGRLLRALQCRLQEKDALTSAELEQLQTIATKNLRPIRPLPPSWLFLVAFFLVFIGLSAASLAYLHSSGWHMLMPVQKIAVFTTLAASSSLLAFSLVRQMTPGKRWPLRPGWLPVALFVLLCLVVTSVFQVRLEVDFLRAGEACMKAGLPYALPAAFIFWLLLRRGAILSPLAAGATAGMLAGLVSTTVLEVHCPNFDLWHILAFHVGIALLGMLAGLLFAGLGQIIGARKQGYRMR